MIMIDTLKEKPITLEQARSLDLFARTPTFRTLLTWTTTGYGKSGVRLEWIRQGRSICTSKEALQRFFERLSMGADNGVRPPSQATKDHAAAERALDALGIK